MMEYNYGVGNNLLHSNKTHKNTEEDRIFRYYIWCAFPPKYYNKEKFSFKRFEKRHHSIRELYRNSSVNYKTFKDIHLRLEFFNELDESDYINFVDNANYNFDSLIEMCNTIKNNKLTYNMNNMLNTIQNKLETITEPDSEMFSSTIKITGDTDVLLKDPLKNIMASELVDINFDFDDQFNSL